MLNYILFKTYFYIVLKNLQRTLHCTMYAYWLFVCVQTCPYCKSEWGDLIGHIKANHKGKAWKGIRTICPIEKCGKHVVDIKNHIRLRMFQDQYHISACINRKNKIKQNKLFCYFYVDKFINLFLCVIRNEIYVSLCLHRLVHDKVRNFTCPQCNNSFVNSTRVW